MKLKEKKCCVNGCENNCSCRINGYECCNKHYLRMLYYGSFDNHPRQRVNTYNFENEDYVEIITKKGQKILVDKEDFDKIKKWSWCVSPQGYAVANINHKVTKINWVLFPKAKGLVQDHINGNKLDNRKSNLRSCTQHQNSMNCGLYKNSTTGFVGVCKLKNGKYFARIMFNRKEIRIGTFSTLEEAVMERKKAEEKFYGEYRRI